MGRVSFRARGAETGGKPLPTLPVALALIMLELLPASGTGGEGVEVVTTFSTGSAEATLYFPQYHERALACLTLPRSAHLLSASMWICGIPGQGGEYPSRATIDLGADGRVEWAFSEKGVGGEMGRQVEFAHGGTEALCAFPPETGSTVRAAFVLPGGARVTSASLELLGEERWVRSWEYDSAAAPSTPLGWSPLRGGFLVLGGDGPERAISLVDPSAGNVSPVSRVRFEGAAPVEALYDPSGDIAAFLRPEEGVLLFNLTTGVSREVLTGQRGLAVARIALKDGWLVVAGPGWVAAVDTASGEILEPPGYSDPIPGFPLALDYRPSTRTAIVASSLRSGWWALSLVQLDSGIVRSCSYGLDRGSALPVSIALLPGTDLVLVAMRSSYYGLTQPAAPVLQIHCLSWARSEFSPFRGTGASLGLFLDGGKVVGLGRSGSVFFMTEFDPDEESWRSYPVALPDGDEPVSWAVDGGGGRLLIAGESTGLWLFELGAGRAGRFSFEDGLAGAGGNVECVMPFGGSLLLGTPRGMVSLNRTTWEPEWLLDCGFVKALDLRSGRLVAASLDGWVLEGSYDYWRFARIRVTVVELGAGGAPRTPPMSRSYFMELPPEWWDCRPTAIALDPSGDRVFIGVAGEYTAAGLFELQLSIGEFTRVETPTPFVSSLYIHPGSGTLFAGCRREGGGLYAVNLTDGRSRLYSPVSAPALLSTEVTSICLDEMGRLITGHGAYAAGYGECIGGLTVFSAGMGSAAYVHAGEGFPVSNLDVVAVARDPSHGRTFLALGSNGLIISLDGSFRPGHFSEPVYFGSSFITGGRSLVWEDSTRTLFGAAYASGFAYTWTGECPESVRVDVGGDGDVEWSSNGPLDRVTLTGLESAVQARLAGAGGGEEAAEVALAVSSSPGIVRIRALSITYDFAWRVELTDALRSLLAAQPAQGDFCAPVQLGARGGGLVLFNLSIEYEANRAPGFRPPPELRVDAASPTPTFLNLTPLFRDDHTPATDLTYELLTPSPASGVRVSVVFSDYLMIEAHDTPFRGRLRVRVEARDSSGLSTTGELWIVVERSGEYIPPPPEYGVFMWAAAAVLLAVGVWAVLLFLRIHRRRE